MLLERERELELLEDVVARAGDRGGTVALIRGEPGAGKSALVREFLARSEPARTFVGYCDDLQAPQPFGALWDMVRGAPQLERALLERNRHEVFEACFELLSASLRPNIMVIEDTQWSDEATLDAIMYLGRRIDRANGVLALTYRDGDVDEDHLLRRVMGDLDPGRVLRLSLPSLSLPAVSLIVGPSGLDPGRVMEATGGNPFLVTEMAATATTDVPSSVRESAEARLARLDDTTREALRHLSVIPRRLRLSELTRLTGATLADVARGERHGILRVEGDMVSFRHELIRRAIESTLTISESVVMHRAILDKLPADAAFAWVMHHVRGANDIERALSLGPVAARAATEVGSHREAVAQYLFLEPHLERFPLSQRAALLRDWAVVEYYLESKRAPDVLDRAIDLYRELGAIEELGQVLVLGVEFNRTHGRFGMAKDYAREALELLEGDGPSPTLAEALAETAWLEIHSGRIRLAEETADRAAAMAEATKAERAMSKARLVAGTLQYVRGQPGGVGLLDRCRERALRAGDRYEEVRVLIEVASIAVEIRDVERAEDYARQAQEIAVSYEMPVLETAAKAARCEALALAGDWVRAEDMAAEIIGRYPKTDIDAGAVLGRLRLRAGGDADAHIDGSWELAKRSDEIGALLVAGAVVAERAWIRKVKAPFEDLREILVRGLASEYPWPAGTVALWLWKLDELEKPPGGLPAPYVDLFAGRVDEAAGYWERRGVPYERALALMSGDSAQRLASLEMLETLGATAVAARVRAALRAEGVPLTRGRGKATRANRAGLTARQSEVLELMAEGLANSEIADRLFISRRTAENHVSVVLAKMRATNRGEAVAAAVTDGLLQPQKSVSPVQT